MPKIEMADLEKVINEELTMYSEEITKEVKKASNDVMKDLVKNTKRDANKRTGAYAKAITSKKVFENAKSISNLWYVKDPEYRKSHLLEKGHATRNGGTTKPQPHIKPIEEKYNKLYEEKIEKAIKRRSKQ